MPPEFTKKRLIAAGLLPAVIAFGLACKFYRGPAHAWVNNFGPASVAYVLLFMLLVFLVVPKRTAITRIAIGVGGGLASLNSCSFGSRHFWWQ